MQIHLAKKLNQLLPKLADRVSQPLSSIFQKEHIVVPASPTRDWLASELSDRLNIWCNHNVYTPGRMLERFGGPEVNAPGTWQIFSALHRCQDRPGFEAPARYLNADTSGLRGIQLAIRISALFSQYCQFRPEMIRSWSNGLPEAKDQWQAELWREVSSRGSNPVAATDSYIKGLAAEKLPPRITLFGVWHLSPLQLSLLRAVADHTDVAVFTIDESPLAAALAGETVEMQEGASPCTSMLERLQQKKPPGDLDDSVSFHSCHGRQREVEILRDQLLKLFDNDETIQPEDVLILTPNVDEYVPLIESVFGADADVAKAEASPAQIPVCFADRAAVADEPALGALYRLFRLVATRRPLSAVVELLDTAPVRDRFRISESDLALIHSWLDSARVRWAENGESRRRFDNPALPHHSWRWGLDRLLLGYALEGGGERLYEDILPVDGIEGPDAQSLGALCEFCESLFDQLRLLEQDHTVSKWRSVLLTAFDALISSRGVWAQSRANLAQALWELDSEEIVSVSAVAHWLQQRFDLASRRGRFFSGGVSVASLRTGRTIPARVVALLGIDHDRFPRDPTPLAFDLLLAESTPGDLSARDEDRLAFRAAVLGASDHLFLSFIGQGSRDNNPRPPSVLVAEILDQMETPVRQAALIKHSMQPFSPFNFQDERVTGFSSGWHAGARSLVAGDKTQAPFFPTPLDPDPGDNIIGLIPLVRFFRNPVQALLKVRLGLQCTTEEEQVPDREPFDLNFLEKWQVGDALLTALMGRQDPERLWSIMSASGSLPMGTPGRIEFDELLAVASVIAESALSCKAGAAQPDRDVGFDLGSFHIMGRIDRVFEKGLLYVGYSKLNARRKLSVWIPHLVGQVSGLKPASTWIVGRKNKEMADLHDWQSIPSASKHLEILVNLYARGMRHPLPFMPNTSCAYADAFIKTKGDRSIAFDKAMAAWKGGTYQGRIVPGESEDPAVAKVFDTSMLESDDFHETALAVFGPMLTGDTVAGIKS
jgi:exodeoxyribonuclease V gamma subunit